MSKSIFLLLLLLSINFLYSVEKISYRYIHKVDDGTVFISDNYGRIYAKLSTGFSRVYLFEPLDMHETKPVLVNVFRDSNGNIYHSRCPLAVFFDLSGALWFKSIQTIH